MLLRFKAVAINWPCCLLLSCLVPRKPNKLLVYSNFSCVDSISSNSRRTLEGNLAIPIVLTLYYVVVENVSSPTASIVDNVAGTIGDALESILFRGDILTLIQTSGVPRLNLQWRTLIAVDD